MSAEPLVFAALQDKFNAEGQRDTKVLILSLFEKAINSSPEPNVLDKAVLFVASLVSLAKENVSAPDDDSFVKTIWEVVISTATSIPCRHYAQDVLVESVVSLNKDVEPWKELRGFGMEMRESWNLSRAS